MPGYHYSWLALAVTALAQSPPSIPLDAQAGLINIPITCAILGAFNQTFPSKITATAPLYGGTGQQIFYSDVSVDITIPDNINTLVAALGAKTANVDVTANLALTNASPTTIQAFSASQNITITAGQSVEVKLPSQPPIGPVTLGAAGSVHRISLGTIDVSFTAYDANGKVVLIPFPTTCGQQSIDYIIGSVAINSTTGLAPYSPKVGSALTFPATPLSAESGGFHIPYDCVFGPLGNQNVDLILSGTVPLYAAPGGSISLTNGQAFLRVPAATVKIAKIGWPTTSAFKVSINSLIINFNNASPATLQVATKPITTTVSIGDGTQDVYVPIPGQGSSLLSIGPVSAGSAGTIASFQVGPSNSTTDLVDSSGATLFSLDVTCQVPFALDLAGIVITTATPGNSSFL